MVNIIQNVVEFVAICIESGSNLDSILSKVFLEEENCYLDIGTVDYGIFYVYLQAPIEERLFFFSALESPIIFKEVSVSKLGRPSDFFNFEVLNN